MSREHPPSDDDDDDQSFTSATSHHEDDNRFTPEEEASLLLTSNALKTTANSLFAQAAFLDAIQTYDRALASCPLYLDYETAVLNSNIAACHIKLRDWKEAIDSATKSVEALERLDPLPKSADARTSKGHDSSRGKEEVQAGSGVVEELDEEAAEVIEKADKALKRSGRTRDEVQRLRVKAMMRRAKARLETGGWASLQGAQEGMF